MSHDHEWRADSFSVVRSGLCLYVDRFWCTEDGTFGWHWRLFDEKRDGCPTVEESQSYSDMTFAGAIAAGTAALDRALAGAEQPAPKAEVSRG